LGVRRGGAGLSAAIFLLANVYSTTIRFDKPIKRISASTPHAKSLAPRPLSKLAPFPFPFSFGKGGEAG
jgi:hypothetical protein